MPVCGIALTQGRGSRHAMTAQFAGSRSIDDRRRRRLAQETSGDDATFGTSSARRQAKESAKQAEPVNVTLASDIAADESLIPRAAWKLGLFSFVGVFFWSGLAWLQWSNFPARGLLGIAAVHAEQGLRFLSVVSLLFATQLCFTIWWYRSRSRKDFGGRYRVWAWAGTFWAVCLVSTGMGLHWPLSMLAYQAWPIYAWKPELLYWLTPFAIGVLALHQLISLEMRHAKWSRSLWNCSLVCGCLVGVLQVCGELLVEGAVVHDALCAATSLWHLLIAVTLLVHARFVVHVTNEAAPRKTARFRRVLAAFLALVDSCVARVGVMLAKLRLKMPSGKLPFRGSSEQAEERRAKQEDRKSRKAEKRAQAASAKAERKEQARLAREEKALQRQLEKESRKKKSEQSAPLNEEGGRKSGYEDGSADSFNTNSQSQDAQSQEELPQESPRTRSGKKRKRVLGTQQRIDSAHSGPQGGHSAARKSVDKSSGSDLNSDLAGYDEEDLSRMTKKERRRARKRKRASR